MAMVFAGTMRYRVPWDFLLALLGGVRRGRLRPSSARSAPRTAREGRPRPPDARRRRLRAAPADAAAGAARARRRRAFIGLDDERPGTVLRAARQAAASRTRGSRRRATSTRRSPSGCGAALARERPDDRAHAPRPCRRLRRRRGAARRDARLDQAQRRSLPARAVPPRRAAVRAGARRGSSASPTRSRASTSSASACRPAKVSVVHYGLDDLPAAWGPPGGPTLPPDAPRAARASRGSSEQKGLDVAIKALAGVRERHPDAVLVVLGDGPQRAALKALAAELGVADAVYLAGSVGDVGGLAPARGDARPPGALGGLRPRAARGDARRPADRRERASARSRRSSSTATTGLLVPAGRRSRASATRSAASSTIRRWRRATATRGLERGADVVLGRDDGRADDRRLPRGASSSRVESRTTASAQESTSDARAHARVASPRSPPSPRDRATRLP